MLALPASGGSIVAQSQSQSQSPGKAAGLDGRIRRRDQGNSLICMKSFRWLWLDLPG